MKKFHAILLFAAAAFAVAVPSAAFAVDADACGVQVSDASEQKAVDFATSADLFEEGASPAVSAAALSQEPVGALQPEPSGESAAGEAPRAVLVSRENSPCMSRGGMPLALTGISCAMERSSRDGNTSMAIGIGSIPRRAAKWPRAG